MIDANDAVHPSTPYEIPRGFNGEKATVFPSGNDFKGITLRTELAARAMQSIAGKLHYTGWPAEEIAKESIKIADALIAELNKNETNV